MSDSSPDPLPESTHSDAAEQPASATLQAALEREQIVLPPEQVAQLDRYCTLLWDWNTRLNLTRHDDFDKFVSRDVVDSLAAAAALQPGERVLDVGTGGGVPGVILAIVRPDLKVELSESVGKKARAIGEIVRDLPLKVPVHNRRAEELLRDRRFDTLVIRAVAPLSKLLTWFGPEWTAFERMLIVKGPAWVEERQAARHTGLMRPFQLRKLATWPLPGTHSESVLLEIKPKLADE